MKILKLAAGFAAGYVLGARAGREKYEQIAATARKVSENPTVVQTRQKVMSQLGADTGAGSSSTPASSHSTRTEPAAPATPAAATATPAAATAGPAAATASPAAMSRKPPAQKSEPVNAMAPGGTPDPLA
ncbi:hypothetical protein GCM10010172_81650 [Paractinoplanes ferrugineus]|uniref:Protoporphyrinogen oxidase n=1 Tax=Paractinoplanes ferrugineus TaxID=113564 RepID=A0A919M8H8_9ACTN|nr:hypothetical protein [Actinoplanes ferrugineus]GIE10486.1 hypothetical protein Afe05nite_23260 [Actinoplanes ferrugineus]